MTLKDIFNDFIENKISTGMSPSDINDIINDDKYHQNELIKIIREKLIQSLIDMEPILDSSRWFLCLFDKNIDWQYEIHKDDYDIREAFVYGEKIFLKSSCVIFLAGNSSEYLEIYNDICYIEVDDETYNSIDKKERLMNGTIQSYENFNEYFRNTKCMKKILEHVSVFDAIEREYSNSFSRLVKYLSKVKDDRECIFYTENPTICIVDGKTMYQVGVNINFKHISVMMTENEYAKLKLSI